jgi:hypothetical protein
MMMSEFNVGGNPGFTAPGWEKTFLMGRAAHGKPRGRTFPGGRSHIAAVLPRQ